MQSRRFARLGLFAAIASDLPRAAAQDAAPSLEARVRELEEKAAAKNALSLQWKDGLRLESADKEFELKIGGRMQLDTFFGDADADAVATTGGPLEDGSQMRRARLSLQGKVYEHVEFKWEHDFSDKDGKAKVMDMYAGIVGVDGLPNLRAGHFREPFGLESLMSANDLVFMERGLPFAFTPFRNIGVQGSRAALEERMTLAAGLFRETSDQAFGQADGAFAATGRVTAIPWCTEKKDQLVHVGLAASRRAPPADEVTFKSKPEANLARDFVDTTKLSDVDSVTLAGAELGVLSDRFSVQGEWVRAEVSRGGGMDDATFCGWYAFAAWTLTGEPRRYRPAEGVFASPKPAQNAFADGGGIGAFELAARMSQIDLDDGAVAGGELRDITVAVNWYLNPVTRVSLNAIRAKLDRAPNDGSASIVEMRVQFAF
ncbi:MAG: porin [Planctomycetes bacterium]|nr:porin [Planctomycetota bacterium]